MNAPGRGPEAVAVHVGDVRATAFGRVELGEQAVGVRALADEVVGGRAFVVGTVGRDAGVGVELVERRWQRVEVAHARHEARVPQAQVVDDGAADVAADRDAAVVAEDVVDERVEVRRERGDVVEPVGREVGVAVAAEVRGDHLESRGRERPDVAPPDPLGFGVAVDEEQREPANALVHERDLQSVAHRRAAYRKGIRIEWRHGRGVSHAS